MTDHQAACAALREAHAAIDAGNLGLAELAVREARRALCVGPRRVFYPILYPSRPQTDLTRLKYREG